MPGDAVCFADGFSIDVDRAGGQITALSVLNEQLIVFKQDRIYAVQGDGPDNLDVGSFAPAQEITTDVGCTSQRSLVRVPDGLMFQTEKGIYLLDQGLRVSYVGADVEAYNGQVITAATLVNDANEVRFLTDEGATLVYNYLFGQWSVWTGHEGTAATLWKGQTYCYAKSTGRVHIESATSYTDAGGSIRLLVETAWIRMDALQGYQLVRRFSVLGEYRSAHTMRVTVSRDYQSETDYSFEWDPSTVMNIETWGSAATWGATAWGGSGSSVYQFNHRPRDQKCEAMRLRFEDVGAVGESFMLTELVLEIGMKGGVFTSSAAKTANSGG
jgi:hypothetical protein